MSHLESIQECETPLNTLFFGFQQESSSEGYPPGVKNKTGIAIDYQNPDDLYGIMRMVFINNSGDHYNRVNEQVRRLTRHRDCRGSDSDWRVPIHGVQSRHRHDQRSWINP